MKYKVGDKVRVRNDLLPAYPKLSSQIRKLRGKVVTITDVYQDYGYRIKEDGRIGYWKEQMFEPYDEPFDIKIHVVPEKRIIIATKGEEIGAAKCHKKDKFDLLTGVNLAVSRLKDPWPQLGDTCWTVVVSGNGVSVEWYPWSDTKFDRKRKMSNNCFRTMEEAKEAAKAIQKALNNCNKEGPNELEKLAEQCLREALE